MERAKSEATKALRYLRARHIAAGGDVGYGDAPTGDQIRAYLASKKKTPKDVDKSQPAA